MRPGVVEKTKGGGGMDERCHLYVVFDGFLEFGPPRAGYELDFEVLVGGGDEALTVAFVHGTGIVHDPDSEGEVVCGGGYDVYEALCESLLLEVRGLLLAYFTSSVEGWVGCALSSRCGWCGWC